MIIDSKFAKDFHSNELTQEKYRQLLEKANLIRDFKNEISFQISSNLFKYLDKNKIDFVKEFGKKINKLSGKDCQCAVEDVFITYSNKFEAIKNKISFKVTKEIKIKPFFKIKKQSTQLCKTLTFLTKYQPSENFLRNYNPEDENKKLFYKKIVELIDKFGYERLIKLSELKQLNILKKYNQKPIEFKSLSFRSINQISKPIIQKSENSSYFDYWINLGAFGENNRKNLFLPTNFSKKYHKNVELYSKGKNQEYKICFQGNKIRLILSINGQREIVENKYNILGVDLNIKHNLFSTENFDIDIDRKLLKDFCKIYKRYDKRKNKQNKSKVDKFIIRVQNHIKFLCRNLINEAKKNGKDHIVLENIENFTKNFVKSDEFEKFKYSRLTRILNFGSIKNWIKSIANKNDIAVSLVPSHYTSQQCSKCGYISKENRKSQEKFKCQNCGHIMNADKNASINIR